MFENNRLPVWLRNLNALIMVLFSIRLAVGLIQPFQNSSIPETLVENEDLSTSPPTASTPTPNLRATQTRVAFETMAAETTEQAVKNNQLLQEASGWPEIFFESFETNSRGWPEGSYADDLVEGERLVNQTFSWNASALQDFWWWIFPLSPDLGELADFYASIDVRAFDPSSGSACFGLTFRHVESIFYFFEICDNGNYNVYYRSGGEEGNNLITSGSIENFNFNTWNQVSVIGINHSYYLLVNNEFLEDFTDSRVTSGSSAFIIDMTEGSSTTFEFDNLSIRSLSETAGTETSAISSQFATYKIYLSNCAPSYNGENHLSLMLGGITLATIQTGYPCGGSRPGYPIYLQGGAYSVYLCVFDSKHSQVTSQCGQIQRVTIDSDMTWVFNSLNTVVFSPYP